MGAALGPHATDRRHGSGVSPDEMNDRRCSSRRQLRRAERAFRKLSTGTRPVVYAGNRIELLRNGAEYFPRLLAAIDAATQSIYIETYIFELDDVGQKVSDALAAAAQRGVRCIC